MDEFNQMLNTEYSNRIATDKTQCVRITAKDTNIVFRGENTSIRSQIVDILEAEMPNVEIEPSTVQIVVMEKEISFQAPATLVTCLLTMPHFGIMIDDAGGGRSVVGDKADALVGARSAVRVVRGGWVAPPENFWTPK